MSNITKEPMSQEDRQAHLILWLENNNYTNNRLADAWGVSEPMVRAILKSETLSEKRRRQFMGIGVPEEYVVPSLTVEISPV